jgi:hypothetical protein
MSDDLSKAFPIGFPNLHHDWDAERLAKFREALMSERDPSGRYQMHADPLTVHAIDRTRAAEGIFGHNSNGSDWTANGRLGGWRG